MNVKSLDMRLIGEMRFPGRPEIVSDVRIYVARWLVFQLPDAAEDVELLDNVRLLATELAVNAIKHTISGRWSHGSFRVRMWLGVGRVRVEVVDQGWWSGPRLRNDPEETSGRGLHILAAMAMKWGVSRRWFGRSVWFELPIQVPMATSMASLDAPEKIVGAKSTFRALPGLAARVRLLAEVRKRLHPRPRHGPRRHRAQEPHRDLQGKGSVA